MQECADGGSNIISMSLGGTGSSNAERQVIDALTEQGILIIAAAGNSGNKDNPMEYPAGYDNVMSVGAVDSQVKLADFSTFNDKLSVAAPGVSVESTHGASNASYRSLSGKRPRTRS
jgi:serine protease